MSSTRELKHTLKLKHYYYTSGTSEQVNDGGQLATGWAGLTSSVSAHRNTGDCLTLTRRRGSRAELRPHQPGDTRRNTDTADNSFTHYQGGLSWCWC